MNFMRTTGGAALLAGAIVLATALVGQAVEPVFPFVEGLRQRGLHEYALLYLDQVSRDPSVSGEIKTEIPLEQGVTLLELGRSNGDATARNKLFGQANEKLSAYEKAHEGTPRAAKASQQLANLLVERGRAAAKSAKAISDETRREEEYEVARKYFDEAQTSFEATQKFIDDTLKQAPIDITDQEANQASRQQSRSDLVQLRRLAAAAVAEKAKTYPPGSPEFKKTMINAAERFGSVYEDYRKWLSGLYSRMYQGQCYADIGDYRTAMSCYQDLFGIMPTDDPDARRLVARTVALAIQANVADKQIEQGIQLANKWMEVAKGREMSDPDWIAVMFQCALAHEALAKTLDPTKDRAKVIEHETEAKNRARIVLKSVSPLKSEAREMLNRLGGASNNADAESTARTFADFAEIGKQSIDELQALRVKKRDLKPGADQAEIDRLESEAVKIRERAQRVLTKAFKIANEGDVEPKVATDRRNMIRYYLCFLAWDADSPYRAAVYGEFLARRYPNAAGARQAGKIALSAYVKLYNDPNSPEKDFAANHLQSIAELIARQWPDSAEADEANNAIVTLLLQQKNAGPAFERLGKISDRFAGKNKLRTNIGSALWGEYLEKKAIDRDDPARPSDVELAAMKRQAQEVLESGVAGLRAAGKSGGLAVTATLALAQAYLDMGLFEQAIKLLEDPEIGPLALVESDNEATKDQTFRAQTYTTALRAYVSAQPIRQQQADKVMDSLDKLYANDADGRQKLTDLFIHLGSQLQRALPLVASDEERAQLAKSFETFLERIRGRDLGDWATRNWIASTYFNLGSGLSPNRGYVSPQAKSYFAKATQEYAKLLDDAKSGRVKPPKAESILSLEMRLAESELKTGQYEQAINRLADVVEAKPTLLEAQKMAAYAYQERGMDESQDIKWLRFAYLGGRKKEGVNRIWGWHKLSQTVASLIDKDPRFAELFHESRYNLTYCRYAVAKRTKDLAERNKYLAFAKSDIRSLTQLFPSLGGPDWEAKYDKLARDIQRSLGENETGVAGIRAEAAAGKP